MASRFQPFTGCVRCPLIPKHLVWPMPKPSQHKGLPRKPWNHVQVGESTTPSFFSPPYVQQDLGKNKYKYLLWVCKTDQQAFTQRSDDLSSIPALTAGERTNSWELSSDLHPIMACGCPPQPYIQSNEENFKMRAKDRRHETSSYTRDTAPELEGSGPLPPVSDNCREGSVQGETELVCWAAQSQLTTSSGFCSHPLPTLTHL